MGRARHCISRPMMTCSDWAASIQVARSIRAESTHYSVFHNQGWSLAVCSLMSIIPSYLISHQSCMHGLRSAKPNSYNSLRSSPLKHRLRIACSDICSNTPSIRDQTCCPRLGSSGDIKIITRQEVREPFYSLGFTVCSVAGLQT